jgi:hypothetical protein
MVYIPLPENLFIKMKIAVRQALACLKKLKYHGKKKEGYPI